MLVEEKMDMSGCIILIKAILTSCMRSKRSKSGRYMSEKGSQGPDPGSLGKGFLIFTICS